MIGHNFFIEMNSDACFVWSWTGSTSQIGESEQLLVSDI